MRFLNLVLDVIDCVRGFDLESDGLASDCLDEDLHPDEEQKSRLRLYIIVLKCTAVFQLIACKDEALLVGSEAGQGISNDQ